MTGAGDAPAAPRNVLVTGAAGYVGALLIDALAGGRSPRPGEHPVGTLVALDWTPCPTARRRRGVRYVELDICAPALAALLAEHAIDVVVHLASIVRTPKDAPPGLAHRVDVDGTRNVLEACRAAGVRRLVVTSSGAAYGYHADHPRWLTETDPLRGNDDFEYARNKRLVEELLAHWRGVHPELAQLVLRPGTVVGPGVASPVTDLFEKPVMLGILGHDTPFVFVWDHDLVELLARGALGEAIGVYNVAGDGAHPPSELARWMGKPYLLLPATLVAAGLRLFRALGLTEHGPERVKFLAHRPVLSNRRLKDELGFVPEKTSREAFEVYARARGLMAAADGDEPDRGAAGRDAIGRPGA